jgi:hypothetical protein
VIQRLGDSREPKALRSEPKDLLDDLLLDVVDPALDMAIDADVVVAEHAAAGDVAGSRLALHRLGCPLGNLSPILGVHFRTHNAGDVRGKVPVLERRAVLIEPHGHARLRDALQLPEGFVAVAATEPRGITENQHLKWRAARGN